MVEFLISAQRRIDNYPCKTVASSRALGEEAARALTLTIVVFVTVIGRVDTTSHGSWLDGLIWQGCLSMFFFIAASLPSFPCHVRHSGQLIDVIVCLVFVLVAQHLISANVNLERSNVRRCHCASTTSRARGA